MAKNIASTPVPRRARLDGSGTAEINLAIVALAVTSSPAAVISEKSMFSVAMSPPTIRGLDATAKESSLNVGAAGETGGASVMAAIGASLEMKS
jgi:hypothetical protein